jgi:hypothetical protein
VKRAGAAKGVEDPQNIPGRVPLLTDLSREGNQEGMSMSENLFAPVARIICR